jgi:hypothetical protein
VEGKTFELKQFHFHTPAEYTLDGEYFPLEMHLVHEAEGMSPNMGRCNSMLTTRALDQAIAVIAAQFQLSEVDETTELVKTIMEKIGEVYIPSFKCLMTCETFKTISNPTFLPRDNKPLQISTAGTVTESSALAFGPLIDAIKTQPLLSYTGTPDSLPIPPFCIPLTPSPGSLTTPPCAEGLKFFVTTQRLPLDIATFNKVKTAVGFNARFMQSMAGSPNLLALAPTVLFAASAQAVSGLVLRRIECMVDYEC